MGVKKVVVIYGAGGVKHTSPGVRVSSEGLPPFPDFLPCLLFCLALCQVAASKPALVSPQQVGMTDALLTSPTGTFPSNLNSKSVPSLQTPSTFTSFNPPTEG